MNNHKKLITDKKYKIPFEFILDYLNPKEVIIKPMFGCFGLYVNDKMYFFLRDREDKKELNGVWIAVDLGFQDPYYFIKYFKKQVNCSPTEFRKSIS